jgi:nitrate reductase assembly molybdenum cofactor insertion protein NarJ
MKTLKVLAVLLSYPDINVYKNIDELAEALKHNCPDLVQIPLAHKYMTSHCPDLIPLTHKYMTLHCPDLVEIRVIKSGQ